MVYWLFPQSGQSVIVLFDGKANFFLIYILERNMFWNLHIPVPHSDMSACRLVSMILMWLKLLLCLTGLENVLAFDRL